MKKSVSTLLILLLVLSCVVSAFAACANTVVDDIVVLFTSDVHCAFETGIGYSGVAAYKKDMLKETPYVTLVDCGDYVQGDLVGAISKGEYIIDIMNEVGYDYTVLGNHEFDYGMDQLSTLLNESKATTLGCNITYTGNGENKLSAIKPYSIVNYGNTDVAYIGVSTPHSITSSTPKYFQDENGKFIYGFSGDTAEQFYQTIQTNIDLCLDMGAEYVVLLTHLGADQSFTPFSSAELIANTTGADVVIDGHAHVDMAEKVINNKDGESVILSSAGTQLGYLGKLTITANGNISTTIVSNYSKKDTAVENTITEIKKLYEDKTQEVVATTNVALSTEDSSGVRMVRNRETAIGNFCADAYRAVSGADIAFVNGGGIRASIPQGEVTFGDLYTVHPFGNTLCVVEATGQEILDALEFSVRLVQKEYASEGKPVGENGGFLQVSGIKFSVDTSVTSTVVTDSNGMFVEVSGARRVKDVYVLTKDGSYQPIKADATYTVASHNYLIKNGGDGNSIFMDNKLIIDEAVADYQMLITYLTDNLKGDLSKYQTTEGRITIS